MRIITIVGPSEASIKIDADTDEFSLKELIASLFNIDPNDIKGIQDSRGVYFTVASLTKTSCMNEQYSHTFRIVLSPTCVCIEPKNSIVYKTSVERTDKPKRSLEHVDQANKKSYKQEKEEDNKHAFQMEDILLNLIKNNEIDEDLFLETSRNLKNGEVIKLLNQFFEGALNKDNLVAQLKTRFAKEASNTTLNNFSHLLDDFTFSKLTKLVQSKPNSLKAVFDKYNLKNPNHVKEMISELIKLAEAQPKAPEKIIAHYEAIDDEKMKKIIKPLFSKLRTYQKAVLHYILNYEENVFEKWTRDLGDNKDKDNMTEYITEQLEVFFRAKIFNLLTQNQKDIYQVMRTYFKQKLNEIYANFIKEKKHIEFLRSKLASLLDDFSSHMKSGSATAEYLVLVEQLEIENKESIKKKLIEQDKETINLFAQNYSSPGRLERKMSVISKEAEQDFESRFEDSVVEIKRHEEPKKSIISFTNIIIDLWQKNELSKQRKDFLIKEFDTNKTLKAAWNSYQITFDKEDFMQTLELLEENKKSEKKELVINLVSIGCDDDEEETESQREQIKKSLSVILNDFYRNQRISEETQKYANKLIQKENSCLFNIFEFFGLSKRVDDFIILLELLVEKERILETLDKFVSAGKLNKNQHKVIVINLSKNKHPSLKAIMKLFLETKDEEDFLDSLEAFLSVC